MTISSAFPSAAAGLTPQDGASGPGAPAIADFRLANGMEVVVIPDHRAPVVTHMVWYRNGSADDPLGKSGIAHFLEHLMFKGTKTHAQGVFSDMVAELGGQENAFTSNDYTAYYQRVAREHLGTLMEFEADRMTGLTLTDEIVGPERDVVLEERRMRTDSDPASQLSEAVHAALYPQHPYGKPVIGWDHEIRSLDRTDALAYYERFYTPENAVLIVAGDVDAQTVRTLAEKTYGRIAARGAAPVRARPQEPPPRAHRLVTLADEKVEQPSHQRLYLVPSYATGEGNDAYALEVLGHVLGGGPTSLFYRELVLEQEIAVAAGAYYLGSALDDTRFFVYGVPAEGVTLEQLDAAMDGVIESVKRHGIEPRDLARSKTRLVADAIYAQDNQASLARWYGSSLTTGMSIAEIAAWPEKIEAVSVEDVKRAAPVAHPQPRRDRLPPARATRCGCGLTQIGLSPMTALPKTIAVPPVSRADTVQRLATPGGIAFWLVEDYAVPLVSLEFGTVGGTAQDMPASAGAASMLSYLLDEGAGPYDSAAFQEALEEDAIELSFSVDRDHFSGRLRTLSKNTDRAFDLLRLAINEPRLDAQPIERVRGQMLAGLKREVNDPDSRVAKAWREAAFAGHPYGLPPRGDLTSVAAIGLKDLQRIRAAALARDTLKIAIVGAIDAARASALVDAAFGSLPARGTRADVADIAVGGLGRRVVVDLDLPQSTIRFGAPGLARTDADYVAGFVVNHILGGGVFSARLFKEVREKRGLAYSVHASLSTHEHTNMFVGSTSTKNERAKESLDVIEEQIADLAKLGPTAEELDKAKKYLTGSYALRFDTSNKIAAQLVHLQLEDYDVSYLDERNRRIEAVTLDDVQRVAKRLWGEGQLLVAVAGRPLGF